jgi:hypothetical protein
MKILQFGDRFYCLHDNTLHRVPRTNGFLDTGNIQPLDLDSGDEVVLHQRKHVKKLLKEELN